MNGRYYELRILPLLEDDLNEILGYITNPLQLNGFLMVQKPLLKNGSDIAARRDHFPGGLSPSSPQMLSYPYFKCESKVDGNSRALFAASAANTR